MQDSLSLQLLVDPVELTFAERKQFNIGLMVTNTSSHTFDPRLDQATLTVNGKHAFSWSLTIQNGLREEAWYKLPPGQSVQMSWPLGEAIFEEAGEYELVLQWREQSSTTHVIVRP